MQKVEIKKEFAMICRDNVELIICRHWNRAREPRNSVLLMGRQIDRVFKMLFKVEKGKYVPSALGEKFGARITGSTFSIDLSKPKIKEICNELSINTIQLIRYETF